MSNEVLIILMFVALLAGLIGLGLHLGFWLGAIALVTGLVGWGGTDFLGIFPIRIWAIMHNYVLVAVPLFVFMGYMLERSGFAEDLFGGVEVMFGGFRGGMAIVTIAICTILAATTGIVATGVIMAGVLALPSMMRRGYNRGLALGSIAAAGTLGILIPPSIMLVFYASQTGLSIGQLFLGAFGPGLLLSTLFIGYVILMTTIKPHWAPKHGEVPEIDIPGLPKPPDAILAIKQSRHPRIRAFRGLFPVAVLLIAVLGSIILGLASPTEASAAGAAGAILIAAAYRKLTFKAIKEASLNTVSMMGMFGAITIGAMTFTAIFSGLGGRQMVYGMLMGLDMSPLGVLLVMLVIVIILGMFIDWVAILLILLPTLIPIQVAMGWDPLWFGMLICVTLQTAWLTPPFGYSLFFLRGLNMPGVTMADITKGCIPFILLQATGVGICIAFPPLVTWLPSLVWGR
ncbi:TRAP transporter large permease subunit [Chloroflexota bacterium]